VLALLVGPVSCDRASLLIAPGTPAPSFALQRLDGHLASFPADYRGKVVALRFWADWCPYCVPEMREIEPLQRGLQERGLAYLAVNVMQPREQVVAALRGTGVTVEVLLDSHGEVTRAYGVMGLPVTVFVDPSGIVRSRIVGESPPATFAAMAEALLAAGSAPAGGPPAGDAARQKDAVEPEAH
jgi:peroxiredoxin